MPTGIKGILIITIVTLLSSVFYYGCSRFPFSASAPSQYDIQTSLSMTGEPLLNKPVLLSFDFALVDGLELDAENTTVTIMLPNGIEVVESSLVSRQEVNEGYASKNNKEGIFTILEWKGDVLKDRKYHVEAKIKAVSTGDFVLRARALFSPYEGALWGGSDNLYISVAEDDAAVSETQPAFESEGVPLYDAEHPGQPPLYYVPFDEAAPLPEEKPLPVPKEEISSDVRDGYEHPLPIALPPSEWPTLPIKEAPPEPSLLL